MFCTKNNISLFSLNTVQYLSRCRTDLPTLAKAAAMTDSGRPKTIYHHLA